MSELEPGGQEVVPLVPDDEPEFIMVGVRRPGGVILFVSRDVTETRFARRTVGHDVVEVPGARRPAFIPRVEIVVGAKMTSFEQVLGDSYLDALKTLARWWEQEKDPRALPKP